MASANIWQPAFHPEGRYFRLFVSHTSAYKTEVGLLAAELLPHGVLAFVAHTTIAPTQEWQDVILDALKECEALAANLTPDFPDSAWTHQEVGAAVAREVLIIPVKVGKDPYGFIGRYQAINGSGIDPKVLARQIADILRTHPLTRHAMAEATVDRFVHSQSWNDARDNLKRLEQLPDDLWTPELAAAVRTAVSENEEIQKADVGFGRSTVGAEALKLIDALPTP